MRKETIIKPDKMCHECGKIVSRGERIEEYFCDNCDAKLKWNCRTGTPVDLRLYHSGCSCVETIPSWNFCDIDCALDWMKTKMIKAMRKHGPSYVTAENYKHLEFTLHMQDLKPFVRRIK